MLELLDHVLELRELFVDVVNGLELVVNCIRYIGLFANISHIGQYHTQVQS